MVAYVVPVLLASDRTGGDAVHWLGLPVIAAGTVLLIWCARDFHVRGRGTLAPWAPPRSLVRTGPYQMSRNPMYVAVLTVVAGWAMWFSSRTLLIYAAGLAIAFHLRVLLYEEPRLRQAFPGEWSDYVKAVPRWLRLTPRR
jgi:protein-S-isoprenylcysteine O-methyltransferase Ste14